MKTASGVYLPYREAAQAALFGKVPYSPALAARVELLQAKPRFTAAHHLSGLHTLEPVDDLQDVGGKQPARDELVQAIAVTGTTLRETTDGPGAAGAEARAMRTATPAANVHAKQAAA